MKEHARCLSAKSTMRGVGSASAITSNSWAIAPDAR
jgi:hypothetical protein